MTVSDLILEAGGQSPGKKEVAQTSTKQARKYFEKKMDKIGLDLDEEIPNFDNNYKKLKDKVTRHGIESRINMPVVSWKQVKEFQKTLSNGDIDIQKPVFESIDVLIEGKTEKIKAVFKSIKAKDLKPVQKQIYLSKVIENFKKHGVPHNNHFITTKYLIVDKNNMIIDGHHRWATVQISNPQVKMDVLKIDLDVEKLIPLTKAYGLYRGNKQNG